MRSIKSTIKLVVLRLVPAMKFNLETQGIFCNTSLCEPKKSWRLTLKIELTLVVHLFKLIPPHLLFVPLPYLPL